MIEPREFQEGCVYLREDKPYHATGTFWKHFTHLEQFEGMQLTKEILRDNFGFTIHDLADFWQCEKEQFVLIQPKLVIIPGCEMPFICGYKTLVGKSRAMRFVHELQIFYDQIEQKRLTWKPSTVPAK